MSAINRGIMRFDKETVGGFVSAWLERAVKAGEIKDSTAYDYRRYIEQDIVPRLGAIQLSRLRKPHVSDWIDSLVNDGRGLTAIRRAHATLRSALTDALERDMVDFNAAARVKLPKVTTARVRPWHPSEAGKFLDAAAEHRLGALFETAVLTGLRRGELVGLTWADVDMAHRTLIVSRQIVRVGKEAIESTVKTDAGQGRHVPLPDRAIAALLAWQIQQSDDRERWESLGKDWPDSGRVFTMHDGRDLRPEYPSRVFDDLVTATGLRKQRFHDLRHLYASLMLSNGEDLTVVSKIMGHSTSQITRDLYAHLVGDRARSAVEGGASLLPQLQPRRSSVLAGVLAATKNGPGLTLN